MFLHEFVCVVFLLTTRRNAVTAVTCLNANRKRVTDPLLKMPFFGYVPSSYPKKSITIHHFFQPNDCRFYSVRVTRYYETFLHSN